MKTKYCVICTWENQFVTALPLKIDISERYCNFPARVVARVGAALLSLPTIADKFGTSMRHFEVCGAVRVLFVYVNLFICCSL